MTDMPTSQEIRDAIAAWQNAGTRDDGRSLVTVLTRVADAQDSILERADQRAESPAERARRATARARKHGVKVKASPSGQWIFVIFPNGGRVRALTGEGAELQRSAGLRTFPGMVVDVKPGAAPGTRPDAQIGGDLTDVLNLFADQMENR